MKSAIMFYHFALVSLMAPPPPRYHRHYGHPPLPTPTGVHDPLQIEVFGIRYQQRLQYNMSLSSK
jgi:hypothetical protein